MDVLLQCSLLAWLRNMYISVSLLAWLGHKWMLVSLHHDTETKVSFLHFITCNRKCAKAKGSFLDPVYVVLACPPFSPSSPFQLCPSSPPFSPIPISSPFSPTLLIQLCVYLYIWDTNAMMHVAQCCLHVVVVHVLDVCTYSVSKH